MRYFYEYKYKNGSKVGGHNLENIRIKNNKIILKGIDIYDDILHDWTQTIDMNEIEYLKIGPMKEVE